MKKAYLSSVVSALALSSILGVPSFGEGAGKPKPPPPVTAMKQEIVTVQDAGKPRQQIVVMNADGTDMQVVLVGERHVNFGDVTWSGDGSKVLFWGQVNGQAGIHWIKVFDLNPENGSRVKFAPGEPVFVTATISSIPHARWSPKPSPDGREWIAYSDETQPTWQIWLVDPDAPHQKLRISSENNRHEYQPTWSPNADRIGFLSAPADVSCSCPGDVEILQLALDSSGQIAVTNRVSLIENNSFLPSELKNQLAVFHFWGTDWANSAEWIATGIPFSTLWLFPTDQLDVRLPREITANDPELSYHSAVWSPADDALLFTRDSYGGVCNVPDNNNQPQLQGGPSSRVIAPLLPSPPDEIDELAICSATQPLDWLGRSYEWHHGGNGLP